MLSTFLFLLCLTDVATAALLLTTGYSSGIGLAMLVAGCLVSFIGLITIVQTAPVVKRPTYSSKSLPRR